jgi:hypothetical protein
MTLSAKVTRVGPVWTSLTRSAYVLEKPKGPQPCEYFGTFHIPKS